MGINRYQAKKIGVFSLTAIIVGFIFSPLPGIDAVSLSLNNIDIFQNSENDTIDDESLC